MATRDGECSGRLRFSTIVSGAPQVRSVALRECCCCVCCCSSL